jgi:hypothetical protein
VSDLPPLGDILTNGQWARLRELVESELTRRHIPGQVTNEAVHLLLTGGTPFVFGLVPLARRLRQVDEREWATIIAGEIDHQVSLDASPPDVRSMPDPLGALKVQLRPRTLVDENPTMSWEPWWPGLLTVLMVDHGEFARSLGPDELERFAEDRQTLYERALRNVADKTPDRMLMPGDTEPMVMLVGDLFTTTHALWPRRYCEIDPDRGVLIGLPTRNCVLLVPVRRGLTTREVELLAGLVDLAYHNEAGPVSTSLYWTSGADEDPDAVELPVTGTGTGVVTLEIPPQVAERMA